MKIQLDTTIGLVHVESSGHYIEVYTWEESYQEGLINLWDYEKDKLRTEPNLSNVLREVSDTLDDFFDDFGIWNIDVVEAGIEELLEPDAIQRLKMRKMEENDDA